MADINYARRGETGITNVVLWIIFGGFSGWIASILVGTNATMGVPANIVTGVVGAFIGGWLADRAGMGGEEGVERPSSLGSFLAAIIGTVILLMIVNAFA
jgi:uncharacterized membrane protein YeaQ/YmgE (transglycosylase-associated protein family)